MASLGKPKRPELTAEKMMESKFQTQGTAICKDCSRRHYVLFKELEESWEDCRADNKGKAHKRGGWRGQHRPREEDFSLPLRVTAGSSTR